MATTFTTTVPDDHRLGAKRRKGREHTDGLAIDTTPVADQTVRDTFAAAALVAFGMRYAEITANDEKNIARACWRMADVMMIIRDDDLNAPPAP
jgi:hypothetical protein